MEREAKLYEAASQVQMRDAQMTEEHDYPEDNINEEHDLENAEYFNYMQEEWEEEMVQQPSTSHVIMSSGEPQQEEDYPEDNLEEFEFHDEDEMKRFMPIQGSTLMDRAVIMDDIEEEEASHQMEIHDPDRNALFEMYAAPTGRRQATTEECSVCGVFLKHPSKIAAHMRTHTGETPFQCDICGRRFTQRTPWRMHMKRHNQDLPFACSYGCGKAFPNAAQRNAHDLRHEGSQRAGKPRPHLKPPKKSIYSNDPHTQFYLAMHQAILDRERGPPVVEVPLFEEDEPLPPPLSAAQHRRIDEVINAVAENRPVRSARACESSEGSSSARSRSRRAPPIVAQCQLCGLMLKHPSKIQAHMRSHTGVKPFKCDKCGLSVATHYALKVHFMRKHVEGDRPLACQWECGLRFVNESAKNEHERIVHKGIKRYFCSVGECCRFFSRRSHLVSHRLRDHPGIVHVDEFDEAVDIDLDDLRELDEEGRDNEDVMRSVMDGMEGEIIEERVIEDGDNEEMRGGGSIPKREQQIMSNRYEQDMRVPSRPRQVEQVKRMGEESSHSTPSPPSTSSMSTPITFKRVVIPSGNPQSLTSTIPSFAAHRTNNMKIPRIVRPRGYGVI